MDTDELRSIYLVFMIEITGVLFTSCLASPTFDSTPQFVQFLENKSTPIGTMLFTLKASDSDSSNEITIFTNDPFTMLYVNVTQESKTSPIMANITLNKELDRESYEGGMELKFYLIDSRRNLNYKSVRLYILDTCDESPQFGRPSYTLEIEEINTVGPIIVYSEIRASDRDLGINSVFTYRMEPKTESEYWMAIYKETFKIDPINGTLYLLKNLDYENSSYYRFTLYAQDTCGLTSNPATLIILVLDVPKATTFFTKLPYTSNEYAKNHSNSQVTSFNGTTISYSANKYPSLDVTLLASLLPVLLVVLIVCTVLGIFISRRKQNAKMSNTKRNAATESVKEVTVTESSEAAYESLDNYYISLDKSKGLNPEYDQITDDYKNKTEL